MLEEKGGTMKTCVVEAIKAERGDRMIACLKCKNGGGAG